jgi:hypothetical protein
MTNFYYFFELLNIIKYKTMEQIYIISLILVLIVLFLLRTKSNPINEDGKIEYQLPPLTLPNDNVSDDQFADGLSAFDSSDTFSSNYISSDSNSNAPLNENAIESVEYKRQMKSLIDYLLGVGYKKKIVNDYVLQIKDRHINPQLILLQFKNNPMAPQPSVSEEMPTG